ncbi:reverse transcriptase domain-containing protein [Tanacetum coccineum]
MPTTRQGMSFEAIEELIVQRVADALLTYKANWNNGNINGIGNGNGSHDEESGSRTMHTARGCTYKEFLNCQPRNFKGTEEADIALTWWNTHMKTVRIDAAYEMSWKELMKMMTKLALLCPRMVPDEEKKIERYIWVLLDSIQGNVTSTEPTRFQDAIRLANSLMDQMVRAIAARQDENKRRCRLHHTGLCTVKCGICKRVGHMTMDCRSPAAATNQRALVAN